LLLKSAVNLRLFFIGCFTLFRPSNLSNFPNPAHALVQYLDLNDDQGHI
jgi:hypothetical protein